MSGCHPASDVFLRVLVLVVGSASTAFGVLKLVLHGVQWEGLLTLAVGVLLLVVGFALRRFENGSL